MTGGVRANAGAFEFLESLPLPLAPQPEQQRIADTLDELFSDLDAAVAAGAGAHEAEALSRVGARGRRRRRADPGLARAASRRRAGIGSAAAHPRRAPTALGGRSACQVQGQGHCATDRLEGEVPGAATAASGRLGPTASRLVLGACGASRRSAFGQAARPNTTAVITCGHTSESQTSTKTGWTFRREDDELHSGRVRDVCAQVRRSPAERGPESRAGWPPSHVPR